MSSHYYLYKASAPDLSQMTHRDGAVDADQCECRVFDATGDVPGWVLDLGIQAEMISNRVDLFAAGEDMFGQRPSSISTSSYDLSIYRYHFEDGSVEEVDRSLLDSYHEDVRFPAFLVELEEIGSLEDYRADALSAFDDRLISATELEDVVRGYMEEYEADLEDDWSGSHYSYPLYMLVKAMFAAQDGYDIVCKRS